VASHAAAGRPLVSRPGHESLSEQRLGTGGGNARAPARRPGRRTDLERGLDGGGDELRGLRVDGDVPAEQYAADDLPDVRGYRRRLGHTRDCRRNTARRIDGHAGFTAPFTTAAGRHPIGPGGRR